MSIYMYYTISGVQSLYHHYQYTCNVQLSVYSLYQHYQCTCTVQLKVYTFYIIYQLYQCTYSYMNYTISSVHSVPTAFLCISAFKQNRCTHVLYNASFIILLPSSSVRVQYTLRNNETGCS